MKAVAIMYRLRCAFLAVACTAAASAWTGELPESNAITPTHVGIHLGTHHTGDRGAPVGGWENINPGIYARWANGMTAGAYRNSLGDQSAYLAWTVADDADRFALTFGAVTGYHKGVQPLLAPSVRVGITQTLSLRATFLAAPKASPAVHLSAEFRR